MKSQENCEDEFALFHTHRLKFCLILSFGRRNALLCEIKKTPCFLSCQLSEGWAFENPPRRAERWEVL